MKKLFLSSGVFLLSSFMAHAQTHPAKVDYFSAQAIKQQLATLEASGSGGTTIGEYANHQLKLSIRTTSGGAESHAHYVDVFWVTQGKATLITGGTIENPRTISEGEVQGSGISGGHTQVISVGDVVHIPAGTPHQLKIAKGTVYSSIVMKIKQP